VLWSGGVLGWAGWFEYVASSPPHRGRAMARRRCVPWVGGVGVVGVVWARGSGRRHGLRRCSLASGVGVDLQLGFLVLVTVDVVVAPGSGFSSASSS